MEKKLPSDLKSFMDAKVDEYNRKSFIETDPISIPHAFSLKQDVEITGFFASIFAWGQRKTIINKTFELVDRMGGEPYNFIVNHSDDDLKDLLGFKHRTFNDTDLLYFIDFLKRHYTKHDSLEDAFIPDGGFVDMESALIHFEKYFFDSPNAPQRTRKHVATPARNSTCKRLSMYLRWMVRSDDRGVDFGIWKKIPTSHLVCPIDVHVDRTARQFGLITRPQTDWKTAMELTDNLRKMDPEDPSKYDFALFGISVEAAASR